LEESLADYWGEKGMVTAFMLKIRNFFPYPTRSILTSLYFTGQDIVDIMLRKRIQGIPPKRLMIGGTRSIDYFVSIGHEFFSYIKTECRLQPYESVLDVGCGIGQKMFPLLNYLGDKGVYEGFDIDPKRIAWLTRNVTLHKHNFRFKVCDIYNRHYNPRGFYKPSEYRFPYDDESFDFVLCASVFTHMLPDDVAHYLAEVRRVLRPEGRCLASFFILTEESRFLMREGKSTLNFRHNLDRCFTTDSRIPETAIAYDEENVCELFQQGGLSIRKPVMYGKWCEREQHFSYQDLIIAVKE
jgi:SAM-dependent methyltransferase